MHSAGRLVLRNARATPSGVGGGFRDSWHVVIGSDVARKKSLFFRLGVPGLGFFDACHVHRGLALRARDLRPQPLGFARDLPQARFVACKCDGRRPI